VTLTVLIDYQSGNLHSAAKAFQRMAAETGAGEVRVSGRAEDLAQADRIVLPGDGAFPACARELRAVPGLVEALAEAVMRRGVPFLGICIGMQMLASRGMEFQPTPGFGWVPGEVVRIAPADPGLKVPHMGWNDLAVRGAHPLLAGVTTGDHAYFVHSYRFVPAEAGDLLAEVDHGGPVAAVVGRRNVVGTQFHPEKSGATGPRIIANFLGWRP
jgi:imidazole glycerol-phosphate synthase subunit HisH